jgi:hypothetical protein
MQAGSRPFREGCRSTARLDLGVRETSSSRTSLVALSPNIVEREELCDSETDDACDKPQRPLDPEADEDDLDCAGSREHHAKRDRDPVTADCAPVLRP